MNRFCFQIALFTLVLHSIYFAFWAFFEFCTAQCTPNLLAVLHTPNCGILGRHFSSVAKNSQLFSFARFSSFSRIFVISFLPCLKSSTVSFRESFPAEI